ncbi:MAG: ABC transporter substrate-binding protein [Alphaproteobacteria bacterium]|nr:ABC transporter substrate-binding protein [Alphaproteobacteria bacterium]
MKTPSIILAAALICAMTAAPARADLVIGVAGPITGSYSTFGEQIMRGAKFAAEQINAAGGIMGEKIELKLVDDACDPKQAVAVAGQLASNGVKYVIGHFCSGSSIPASKVYMEEGMIEISPSSTNPKLTDEAETYIFRVCGRDDQQGAVIGNYIVKYFAGKKIAVIHDKSTAGKGQADQARETINAGGIKEVMYEAYNAGERDYSALVTKLKEAGVELLMIGGYHTEAGLIARQLRDAGADIQVFGGDALTTEEYWSIAGTAGEGTLFTFGPDPRKNSLAKDVVEAIRKTGYEPEGYTLYTYAAMQALAGAIEKVGSAKDTKKIAGALRAQSYDTVLGPIGFNEKGDVKGPAFVVYRWHDGKYAEVENQ